MTDRARLNCAVSEGLSLCPVSTTSNSFMSRSGLATVMVRSGRLSSVQ